MQGDAPETMETLRAALLAAEHRATTAEATVAALMADGAATLAALRDAAVAEAARHATAAERARCLAAASRVGAFAACDEMLRAAPDAGETPPQAFGRGVAEGRRQERDRCDAAAVRIGNQWARREHRCACGSALAGLAAAEQITAAIRAPQGPPQRPEAPRDGATPAPDAPSPAGGLPAAAAGVCGGRTEHVCSRCDGTGRRVLSGQRQRVLDAVRSRGVPSPCEVTDALDGVDSATAMNRAANVCAWLAREGFLRAVKRDGKRVIYAATENGR